MKKLLMILVIFAVSCKKGVVQKPDNLIPEQEMIDILYDLSILEAIRTQRPVSLETHNIDPHTYIYRKYDIDSLQFASSNKYYASDVERYKKIFATVDKRLETNKKKIDDHLKKSGKAPVSTPDDPVVR